ncbi:hypothetical protein DMC30DRAFT_400182 [Rhodotorula diobovata]|uniref:Uncharacterized protein n=1 Tax=Rhodotorula diobovata TaxID=5288 RepID=A0A5C5FS59_9BASI|nr:hypothetical protein DMC30DRAFT_400182 [Rhodotorula diobovata]
MLLLPRCHRPWLRRLFRPSCTLSPAATSSPFRDPTSRPACTACPSRRRPCTSPRTLRPRFTAHPAPLRPRGRTRPSQRVHTASTRDRPGPCLRSRGAALRPLRRPSPRSSPPSPVRPTATTALPPRRAPRRFVSLLRPRPPRLAALARPVSAQAPARAAARPAAAAAAGATPWASSACTSASLAGANGPSGRPCECAGSTRRRGC